MTVASDNSSRGKSDRGYPIMHYHIEALLMKEAALEASHKIRCGFSSARIDPNLGKM